jgi:hypothetical protein
MRSFLYHLEISLPWCAFIQCCNYLFSEYIWIVCIDATATKLLSLILLVMIYSGSHISRWIITISDRKMTRSDRYISGQSQEWYNGSYVGVKLINVLAGLDVGLCCARFMGSVSTSHLLEWDLHVDQLQPRQNVRSHGFGCLVAFCCIFCIEKRSPYISISCSRGQMNPGSIMGRWRFRLIINQK